MLVFAALAFAFELWELDYSLADPFFDLGTQRFIGRRTFWADQVIHRGGRWLVIAVFAAGAAAFGFSFLLPRLREWRRASLYLCLCIVLCTGTVGLLKSVSARYCPWDLERYGGFAPHLGLLERAPAVLGPGHCFPSAHASGGFSLMALYFIFRERSRRLGRAALVASLALGLVYSVGQLARGAHFVSHSLWSAAICWGMALLLYLGPFGAQLSVKIVEPEGRPDV